MDDKINLNYALDSQGARLERSNRRLFILLVIFIITTFTLAGTLVYTITEYETVVIEAEQQADGDSSNYIIGGNYGGETNSESN